MHRYLKTVQNDENGDDAMLGWLAVAFVTMIQLAAGLLFSVGCLLAVKLVTGLTVQGREQIHSMLTLRSLASQESATLFLAAVHGIGSFFTTLGIFYGSATLVQVVKLLEPFETLLLAEYIVPCLTGRGDFCANVTKGKIFSMALVVFSSISLVVATEA